MDASEMNTSISFEIPLDEEKTRSPRTPRATHLLGSPNRSVLCETDLAERLGKADQRRCNVLEETRTRNAQVVRKVMTVREQKVQELLNRSTDMLVNIEEDQARKAQRRQQAIEEKINLAKKEARPNLIIYLPFLSLRKWNPELMRQIYEDMSNKENKRRSYIQGIVEHCQHEVAKVGQVRSRRSMNGSVSN
ncbi:hypothetical protein P879_03044 [Paragonimus westermani]|uniref:Uncharacterized protein n=1 Tax=Paragonimus westermani TaxID=34504 RepID=A0A8T0DXQ2_9TREM|nr:hypothetical protein P879_03044 [Paragonimus westermani]